MEILIITMHRVPNYGSVLQTFALQKVLEDAHHKVRMIDYYPERQTALGLLKRIKYKVPGNFFIYTGCRVIMIPSYIRRYSVFRRFLKKNLQLTRKYQTVEELKADIPKADLYCTGSDQVWNSDWSEGLDEAYCFSFLPEECKRISYAASFGKDVLPECDSVMIKNYLQHYRKISVRENSAVEVLKKAGIPNGIKVLDPVFLIDRAKWHQIASDRYAEKKYILIYNLNRSKILDKYANLISKTYGLPLYYVGYSYHESIKPGHYICCPKVEDFLALIEHAQYVIADSFHATAFSIIFRKQFVSLVPKRFGIRITDLLDDFDLRDRTVTDYEDMKLIQRAINYDAVESLLEEKRRASLEFLFSALEEEC